MSDTQWVSASIWEGMGLVLEGMQFLGSGDRGGWVQDRPEFSLGKPHHRLRVQLATFPLETGQVLF